MLANYNKNIFSINSAKAFEESALFAFNYQYNNNIIYRRYVDLLKINPLNIKTIDAIPYLPIEFFKSQKVITGDANPQLVFSSSGTTSEINSQHFVTDPSMYVDSLLKGFLRYYGKPTDYIFLALLPSYLERGGSSLVYMVNELINLSGNEDSGFYLNELEELAGKLKTLQTSGKRIILIGVTYALLDLIEGFSIDFPELIVMETGGMKGRRKEITRPELHDLLCKGFGVKAIHSEYGMTELLSQAYSLGNGIFECPPWMKVSLRDVNDPLTKSTMNTGGINVIDLANINSCCFIATQDLGKIYENETFEILGRFDNSAIRGCNLMVM